MTFRERISISDEATPEEKLKKLDDREDGIKGEIAEHKIRIQQLEAELEDIEELRQTIRNAN